MIGAMLAHDLLQRSYINTCVRQRADDEIEHVRGIPLTSTVSSGNMGIMHTTHDQDLADLHEHVERDVKEFLLALQQTTIYDPVVLNMKHHMLNHTYRFTEGPLTSHLREDPYSPLAISGLAISFSSYRALASAMVILGRWEKEAAEVAVNNYNHAARKVAQAGAKNYTEPSANHHHVMNADQLNQFFNFSDRISTVSPLAESLVNRIDLSRLHFGKDLQNLLFAIMTLQSDHYNAEKSSERSKRKHNNAIIDNHAISGSLVSAGVFTPARTFLVNTNMDPQYLNLFLNVPDTHHGMTQILKLMEYVVSTGYHQSFSAYDLKTLVDDESNQDVPTSLVFNMYRMDQGQSLERFQFFPGELDKSGNPLFHGALTDEIWKD